MNNETAAHPLSNTESELFNYQAMLLRLGALAGEPGSYTVSASAKPLFQALHRVLAGGEVRVEVVEPGIDAMYERLEHEFENFMRIFNASLEQDQPLLFLP
ncbi:MAG: hypothetical protein V3V08_09050 [Nannocystaceae bacterium]